MLDRDPNGFKLRQEQHSSPQWGLRNFCWRLFYKDCTPDGVADVLRVTDPRSGKPQRGCGECRDCRLALSGEHPDVQLIEREGAAISAAQAEDIVRRAALAPVEGRRKVLVLDEFHLLRPEAAARLLKTIEEPSPSTVFTYQ